MDEREDLPTVEILRPTTAEVEEGLSQLRMCWPTWQQTPAMLVNSEDNLGLIVTAVDYLYDKLGFVVQFAIEEKLVTPANFNGHNLNVSFGWNQPYLSLDPESISAPYAYYVHFEHAGVQRARELIKAWRDKGGQPPRPRLLRSCFGPRGAAHFASMMSSLNEQPDAG